MDSGQQEIEGPRCARRRGWLWAIEYRRYRVLVLRNSLFEARDALFAAAAQGKLSFDDPAYGMTRVLLNGMLRQADAFSVLHFVGMLLTRVWWSEPGLERRFNDRYLRAQMQLTEVGREVVRRVIDRAHVAIFSHVLHVSFVFGPALHLLKIWRRVRTHDVLESILNSRSARGAVYETLGALDASAHLVGDLDATPSLVHAI